MDPFQKDGERLRKQIQGDLEQYPYSFKLDISDKVHPTAYKGLQKHLKEGLRAGYTSSWQTASVHNLLAFVLFQLHEHAEALEETEKALEMDDQKNNIVSLANKIYMLSTLSSDDAEEALDELHRLKELQKTHEMGYLLIKAKAELAASYLRFGPRFNKHAIDGFREVIPQAKEPEVWQWKFCLAVAYRHALDLQHAPYVSGGQYTVTHSDALKLLREIIESATIAGEKLFQNNLKANAYAEMGVLLRLAWDKTTEYQLCSQVQAGPLACCKKALELDDEDASVLWKSGKLYRYNKDLFKSRKLLEKAVEKEPSSAAYHHLGLTYKAMATNQQYGKLKTRRGGRREKQRRKGREERAKTQNAETKALGDDPGDAPPVPQCSRKDKRELEQLKRIQHVVKSPGENVTQFQLNEGYVQKAIENLQMAVEFSAKDNSRAVYDLALLYKATKNVKGALDLFQSIVRRQNGQATTPSGLLEQITSLEQMGLIYKDMAEDAVNEEKRRELLEKSTSRLYRALSLAARFYSNVTVMKNIFGKVFHSPSELLKAADTSDKSDGDKKMTRAKIYSLINNNKEAQGLLAKIAENERDANCIKLEIEVYSKSGEHEKAAATLSLLKSTELHHQVVKLFENQQGEHSMGLFDIYFNAGRKTLLEGPCEAGYFTDAFKQKVKAPVQQLSQTASSSSGDVPTSLQGAMATEGTGPGETEEPLDIMLLHDDDDDDIANKAVRLRSLLKIACGLKAVCRDEGYPLGSRERTSILNNIENSRLVLILPGKEERLEEFEEFVSVAATKKFAVLLTGDIGPEAIPKELKTPRVLQCPDLFDPEIEDTGPYTDEFITSLCSLFQFLVNCG